MPEVRGGNGFVSLNFPSSRIQLWPSWGVGRNAERQRARPRLAALTTNTGTRCYSPQRDNYAVLYDRGGLCARAFRVAFLVLRKKFRVIRIVAGAFRCWVKMG